MPANAPTLVAPSTALLKGPALVPTEVELRPAATALSPNAVALSPFAAAAAPTAVLKLPVALAWQFALESKSVSALLPELQPAMAGEANNVRLAMAQPTSNAMKCFRVLGFIIHVFGTAMIMPRYDNRLALRLRTKACAAMRDCF
jgi:hypothetical protein